MSGNGPPPASELNAFVLRLLAACLDIRAVWSMDHEPAEGGGALGAHRLLAFGSGATLERLRKCEALQAAGFELCVVTDEDAFESAWGSARRCGSLARSAWRRASAGEAFYDETRWAATGEAGAVVRVRRKALLVWQAGAARGIGV